MNKDLREIWWGLLALLLSMAVVTLCGCRTSHASARERVIVRDSINIVTHTHTDTLHIIVRDTIYERIRVQDSTHASMTLDNGTLDMKNGTLTGIKTLDLTNVLNGWRERAEVAERELARSEFVRDSLLNIQHDEDASKEREKDVQRVGWWQWFSSIFTAMALLILITYVICRYYDRKSQKRK